MIATLAAGSLTDTIESFFAGIDLHSTDTLATDLVIDELDQWSNSANSAAAAPTTVTYTFGAVTARRLPVGS